MKTKSAPHSKEIKSYTGPAWQQYLTRPLDELGKIRPKWACGKHLHKAMYTRDFLEAGCTVHYASPKEIIATCEFGEVRTDSFFTDNSINDIRVARLLYRWEHREFVDPPNIFVKEGTKKIMFGDGRHRTKTAFLLGQKRIPLLIPNEDLSIVSDLLTLYRNSR